VDPFSRPHRWSEGEGHFPIEISATPEGVVGKATRGEARKAMRPLAAILRYLTLVNDEILKAFPAGKVPPVEEITLRTQEEWSPSCASPEQGLEERLRAAAHRPTTELVDCSIAFPACIVRALGAGRVSMQSITAAVS